MKTESGRVSVASKSDAQEAPQKSDMDDEELEYEPDKLNRELDVSFGSTRCLACELIHASKFSWQKHPKKLKKLKIRLKPMSLPFSCRALHSNCPHPKNLKTDRRNLSYGLQCLPNQELVQNNWNERTSSSMKTSTMLSPLI